MKFYWNPIDERLHPGICIEYFRWRTIALWELNADLIAMTPLADWPLNKTCRIWNYLRVIRKQCRNIRDSSLRCLAHGVAQMIPSRAFAINIVYLIRLHLIQYINRPFCVSFYRIKLCKSILAEDWQFYFSIKTRE